MGVDGAVADLRRLPMFAEVEPGLLAHLEQASFLRKLARGQVLFIAGEPADHLFVVRAGLIKVHVTSDRGAELVLELIGPGRALGELSVIDQGPRSADATALETTELLAIPSAAVRELIETRPEVLMSVARSLAVGMRRLTGQAGDLVFLDLPRRLAKMLVGASNSDDSGTAARLSTSQAQIAAMLGVTRQSLNRALVGFVRRGWIEVKGQSITLLDRDALVRFSAS